VHLNYSFLNSCINCFFSIASALAFLCVFAVAASASIAFLLSPSAALALLLFSCNWHLLLLFTLLAVVIAVWLFFSCCSLLLFASISVALIASSAFLLVSLAVMHLRLLFCSLAVVGCNGSALFFSAALAQLLLFTLPY
jgi:hypothetical protein